MLLPQALFLELKTVALLKDTCANKIVQNYRGPMVIFSLIFGSFTFPIPSKTAAAMVKTIN
jgi:hypothetical protein